MKTKTKIVTLGIVCIAIGTVLIVLGNKLNRTNDILNNTGPLVVDSVTTLLPGDTTTISFTDTLSWDHIWFNECLDSGQVIGSFNHSISGDTTDFLIYWDGWGARVKFIEKDSLSKYNINRKGDPIYIPPKKQPEPKVRKS
jgi:hypothetical protein